MERENSLKEGLKEARNTSQQIDFLSRILEGETGGGAVIADSLVVLEELRRVSRKRGTLPFRTVAFLKALTLQNAGGKDADQVRKMAGELLREVGRIDVSSALTSAEESVLIGWLSDPLLAPITPEAIVKAQESRADLSHTTSIAHHLCGRILDAGFFRGTERLMCLETLSGLVDAFGPGVMTPEDLDEINEMRLSLFRFFRGRRTLELMDRILGAA